MKKATLSLFRRTLPPRVRAYIKEHIGVPVPADSAYEVETQAAMRHLLQRSDVAFDVGANIGELSVVLSRLVGPSGHIYSFEANPRCRQQLERTLRLNRVRNCTVVFGAVTDGDAPTARLFADERRYMHGVASSVLPQWAETDRWTDVDARREIEVPALTLDGFCAQSGVRPALVKVDVEGAEARVFAGFQRCLADVRPHVLFEAGRRSMDHDPFPLLERLGYRFAVPAPWRWISGSQFYDTVGFAHTVVGIHESHSAAADGWIS